MQYALRKEAPKTFALELLYGRLFNLCKFLLHKLHVVHDAAVEDAGVVARHFGVGVAEHLGDILHRNTVRQADRRCKRMPARMRGQLFGDAAHRGDLF